MGLPSTDFTRTGLAGFDQKFYMHPIPFCLSNYISKPTSLVSNILNSIFCKDVFKVRVKTVELTARGGGCRQFFTALNKHDNYG